MLYIHVFMKRIKIIIANRDRKRKTYFVAHPKLSSKMSNNKKNKFSQKCKFLEKNNLLFWILEVLPIILTTYLPV